MGTVRYKVENNVVKEIHKIVVHSFSMGDVEDPDLYAAQPLMEWQESDPGKFVMEHAVDKPEWHRHIDHTIYGHRYAITAELEAKKLSEFYLRWGKDGSGEIR
jgi:hypothetical protein